MREFLETARARRWSAGLERAVFGTTDSGHIADMVTEAVTRTLSDAPPETLFLEVSTAIVLGMRLRSGNQIALKIFQPSCNLRHLRAVRTIQAGLARDGYPAPTPIAGPFRLGDGHAVVDALLRVPPYDEDVTHAQRRVLACGLAEFIRRCSAFELAPDLRHRPFPAPGGGLWGPRIRPEVDLSARTEGGEWIDDLGRRGLVLAHSGSGRDVIGHGDWLPHNVRLDGEDIVAVFDWDSVYLAAEPALVGKAIIWGSADEAMDFVDIYEVERGARFDAEERRLMIGVGVWMRAFLARWEYSQQLDGTGLRDNLRNAGEALLEAIAPR